MAEVKEIKEIKVKLETRYNGPNTSKDSIKGILRKAGYKDKDIERMHEEQCVMIVPGLRHKLRQGQQLFVIEKKNVENPNTTDRFADLEEE